MAHIEPRWHATVEYPHTVADQAEAETLAQALVDAGAWTARVDADRDRVAVGFIVEETTLRRAAEAAQRQARQIAEAGGVTKAPVRMDLLTEAELEAELLRPALPELVGLSEAGEILGVSRQRVAQLAAEHDDFPGAVAELASGRIYTADSVRAFGGRWERKRTGRPVGRVIAGFRTLHDGRLHVIAAVPAGASSFRKLWEPTTPSPFAGQEIEFYTVPTTPDMAVSKLQRVADERGTLVPIAPRVFEALYAQQ